MAESQKPPAASLTDPIIGGTRLGGGGMFMGGGTGLNMLMPLSITDISQSNFQTKIGNPMFASANIATPENLAMLGRQMAGIQSVVTAKAKIAGNMIGGHIGSELASSVETATRNAFYGKKPTPVSSTNALALYEDYRAIRAPLSNARLSGVAGGIGQTTVASVANKLVTSAARGAVFSAVMPILPLGEGSEIDHHAVRQREIEKEAEKKMFDAQALEIRRGGMDPQLYAMGAYNEVPQEPLWTGKQRFTPEEIALGDYEAILEKRARDFKETERLSKLPTFNAVQDNNSFMSAHFLRQ